jgi:hypothetical protein
LPLQKLVGILPNLVEKLFPGLCGSVQEVHAYKIPYQHPRTYEIVVLAYLRADVPTYIYTAYKKYHTSPAVIYRSIHCTHILGKQDTYLLWIFHTGPNSALSWRPASTGILRSMP